MAGLVSSPVTIKNIEYAIIDRGFKEGWVKPRVPKVGHTRPFVTDVRYNDPLQPSGCNGYKYCDGV